VKRKGSEKKVVGGKEDSSNCVCRRVELLSLAAAARRDGFHSRTVNDPVDNRNEVYHHFSLSLNWDVTKCLRVGAAAAVVLSTVYTLGVGYAFIELRMPPR
jgi:hypothetical protein